jgi:hypothetical protein
MHYEIDKEFYQIRIKGNSNEIKLWVKEICNAIDKGDSYSRIKDEVDNLENIIEPFQFTFGRGQRIYFDKNSILYAPNVSGKEAKEFHFKALIEPFFQIARKKVEEYNQ